MNIRCTRKIGCECEYCERQREREDEIRAERYCVACMQRLNDVTEPNVKDHRAGEGDAQ